MMLGAPLRALFKRRKAGEASASSGQGPDAASQIAALEERGVRVFHLYCEADEGLDYFNAVLSSSERASLAATPGRFEVIEGANHVCTLLWSQDRVVESVCAWAHSAAPPSERSA